MIWYISSRIKRWWCQNLSPCPFGHLASFIAVKLSWFTVNAQDRLCRNCMLRKPAHIHSELTQLGCLLTSSCMFWYSLLLAYPSPCTNWKQTYKSVFQVINCSQTYRRTQCQWNMLLESAFELEDIALNEVSTKATYVRSFGKYDGIFARCYNPTTGESSVVFFIFLLILYEFICCTNALYIQCYNLTTVIWSCLGNFKFVHHFTHIISLLVCLWLHHILDETKTDIFRVMSNSQLPHNSWN